MCLVVFRVTSVFYSQVILYAFYEQIKRMNGWITYRSCVRLIDRNSYHNRCICRLVVSIGQCLDIGNSWQDMLHRHNKNGLTTISKVGLSRKDLARNQGWKGLQKTCVF